MPVQPGGPNPLRFFHWPPFFFTLLSLTPTPVSLYSLALSLSFIPHPTPRITRLFGRQSHAASPCSICTVHLDGIVC